MDSNELLADTGKCVACEDFAERFAQFRFPADAQAMILHAIKRFAIIESIKKIAPSMTDFDQLRKCSLRPIAK